MSFNGYLFTQIMPSAVLAFINADLGPDTNYVWISVSWNLVAAVVVTVSGRLADIFGRRWFLIAGAAISTVGGIVGLTSQSINQSIASGVLFGLGGGMQEMVFSCIQELVPNNKRYLTIGKPTEFAPISNTKLINTGIFEGGNLPSMFSALISYSFIQYTSTGWRSCYAFCIAVEGAATVALFFFYYPPSFATKHLLDKKSRWQLVMETDFVGLFTFSAACTLLLLAINWVSRTLPVPRLKTLSNTGRCAASMEECCSDCSYRGLWCTLYLPWLLGGICRLITPTSACATIPQVPRVSVLKASLSLSLMLMINCSFTAILVVVFVAGMLYYSNLIIWPRLTSLIWIPADDIMKRGLYANISNLTTPLAALYGILVMPWVNHERWQVTGLATIQTAFTGALASVGPHTQGMTIFFLLCAGTAATATNIMVFGTVSLLLEDQTDM